MGRFHLVLTRGVLAEGAAFGDVDGDGQKDLIAGPLRAKCKRRRLRTNALRAGGHRVVIPHQIQASTRPQFG